MHKRGYLISNVKFKQVYDPQHIVTIRIGEKEIEEAEERWA
jgi:hypothetical protein